MLRKWITPEIERTNYQKKISGINPVNKISPANNPTYYKATCAGKMLLLAAHTATYTTQDPIAK